MITKSTTLIPCYGRDYNSKAAVIADFEVGKDFEAVGYNGAGKCSISDFTPGIRVTLRYRKLTMATSYVIK